MTPNVISSYARVHREIRKLSVVVSFLSVILLMLHARVLIDEPTVGIGVAAAVVATLSVFAAALLRHGRRLEIALASSAQTSIRGRW